MTININSVYKTLRGKSVVVGLTGAIGSGCTEAAKFLSNIKEEKLDLKVIQERVVSQNEEYDQLEKYRVKKISAFLDENDWQSFYHLRISDLIFSMFFASDFHRKNSTINKENAYEFSVCDWLCSSKQKEANELSLRLVSLALDKNPGEIKGEAVREALKDLNLFIEENVKKKGTKYTEDFQKIGNLLREKGVNCFIDCSLNIPENDYGVFTIAQFAENIIKRLNAEGVDFIVIDALRNLHEINYFKSTFANFYLFSIVADAELRRKRMMGCFKFTSNEVDKVQGLERDKSEAYSQNINLCISNGDVFFSNNLDLEIFRYSLLKYVCLIRRPGLFTPTRDERNMQIALTARYNSGCISRQVGACVTGKDGYILGIGWNDVPEGSVPCLYRSSYSLLIDNNAAPEFSEYESGERFKSYLRNEVRPTKDPFCFKDLENKRHAEDEIDSFSKAKSIEFTFEQKIKLKNMLKNPTRERALHAEENAFLQSAKVGGGSLKGGELFTTASPCQLCAKKAMQLGITRIIYIDAYPDISTQQTLESGAVNKRPKVAQFSGAAESAFMKLFKPLINIKDELGLL